MEDQNEALKEIVEEENNDTDSPSVEARASEETEEVETEPAGDEDTEPEETDEKVQKKGYSQRVRELNARAKEAEAKAESLAQKLQKLTDTSVSSSDDYQYAETDQDGPIIAPDEEIDALELDRRLRQREQQVLKRADARTELRIKQTEAINRINREADEAIRAYPELDPDSDNFNKELSEAIAEATEAYVIKNPYSASVTKFVDRLIRPYKGAVSKEVGDLTGSVAKQVSEAALRPKSVREKERPASEKSIAELEEELGIIQA